MRLKIKHMNVMVGKNAPSMAQNMIGNDPVLYQIIKPLLLELLESLV